MRLTTHYAVALGIAVIVATAAAPSASAPLPDAACKEAKAKAAGKKAGELLKAFGKNVKKPDATKLGTSISKAQSKFTKGFSRAESRGGCATTGDAAQIEAKVDAFVSDTVVDVSPPPLPDVCSTAPSIDPFNAHIPDIPFPDVVSSDLVILDDLSISFREILVSFSDLATVQEACAVMDSFAADLIGGLPYGAVVLLRLPSASSLDEMMGILTLLNAQPAVELAVMEMATSYEQLPPHNVTPNIWTWEVPTYPAGPTTNGNWGLKLVRAPQLWNLDTFARRAPAEGNVAAGVVDDGFTSFTPPPPPPPPPPPVVGSNHADLDLLSFLRTVAAQDHGTEVSGFVGAAWNNNQGVEGINPWLYQIYGRSKSNVAGHASFARNLELIEQTLDLLRVVKAVNNSYGLSGFYKQWGVNPGTWEWGDLDGDNDHMDTFIVNTRRVAEWAAVDLNGDLMNDTYAVVISHYGDLYRRSIDRFANGFVFPVPIPIPIPGIRGNFLLVSSAGNAGSTYNAVDNSPINNAAVRFGDRFLAVESIDWNNRLSRFSNINGSVSAPGECVRSTEANDATNFDDRNADGVADCVTAPAQAGWNNWWDGGGAAQVAANPNYATQSGTSFAAPHVTGLITALWKLDPALTAAQVRGLVIGAATTAVATPTAPPAPSLAQPRIDAFAAAMGIDVVRADKKLQKALVDVDDGSAFDGNARGDKDGVAGEATTIGNPDSRRGDGTINMKDLRAFRDALTQVMTGGVLAPGDVALDGANAHFKKDLNFDGCVGTAGANPAHPVGVPVRTDAQCANGPAENVFARYDFNGNGKVDPEGRLVAPPAAGVAPFKVDPDTMCTGLNTPAGCLRDVDVLADGGLWTVDGENVSLNAADEGMGSCAPDTCPHDQWLPTRHLLADRDGGGAIDYLLSADLHFDVACCPVGTLRFEVESWHNNVVTWTKTLETDIALYHMVTVPLFDDRRITVSVGNLDDMTGVYSGDFTSVKYGEDCTIQPFANTATCGIPGSPSDAFLGMEEGILD